MSLATDIRTYADSAFDQGKQVLDQAQTQLFEAQAKALETVTDLRTQAEKVVNLEAIKAAIEPYLAQAKGYSTSITDRAEDLYASVRNDKRVSEVVSRAEQLTGTVVETVQDRVVKPVQTITGLGAKPASSTKPAPKAAPKPASVRVSSVASTSAKPSVKVTATRRPAARKSPAAKTAKA